MENTDASIMGRVWDSVWEDVFLSQEWGKYPGEELIRFVARNFYRSKNRKDVRILEVGCGPGANLWFLAREGFSFTGIDGSKTAIDSARARLEREVPEWSKNEENQLTVGDIQALPFPDGHFDAVIDNEAVYCNDFVTSLHIYSECARVLKDRGSIFLRTFGRGSWGANTGKQIHGDMWLCAEGPLAGKGPSRFTSIDDVPKLLEEFDIESIEESSVSHNRFSNKIIELIVTGRKKRNDKT
jgi:SAM-dependent methyltransferase